MLRLLACLAVACCVGPASACINEVELPGHEREFRSQYRRQAAPALLRPRRPSRQAIACCSGAASVLLLGAFGLVVVGRRARG